MTIKGAPATATARIERSYITSVDKGQFQVVDDFSNAAGIKMSSNNVPNSDMNFLTAVTSTFPAAVSLVNHDPVQKAALLTWDSKAGIPFLETNLTKINTGMNVSANPTLQFRVGRVQENPAKLNMTPMTTDFSVQLVGLGDPADTTGSLNVGQYAQVGEIRGPASSAKAAALNPNWQTIRIPLNAFPGGKITAAAATKNLHGVGFTFNKTTTGAIYLADVRLSRYDDSGLLKSCCPPVSSRRFSNEIAANAWGDPSIAATPVATLAATLAATPGATPTPSQLIIHSATLLTPIAASTPLPILGATGVELQISSASGFPVENESLILTIGGNAFDFTGTAFDRFGYALGDIGTIIFTLTDAEYTTVYMSAGGSGSSPVNVEAYVHYGYDPSNEVWDLGMVTLPPPLSLGIEPTPTPVATATP